MGVGGVVGEGDIHRLHQSHTTTIRDTTHITTTSETSSHLLCVCISGVTQLRIFSEYKCYSNNTSHSK